MEMDESASLELSDPARSQPHGPGGLGLGAAQYARQAALDVDRGSPPQLGLAGVLHDAAGVVVAVGAKGTAHNLVVEPVRDIAQKSVAMRASRRGTWVRVAGCVIPGAVDDSKPRRRQGEEHSGMGADPLVHALAALEAGPDEVAGIPAIDGGTSRAPELAARAARLEDDTIG
jgi:hypothetical protein